MEWKILMITLKNITDCDLRTQQLVLGWRNKPRIRMMMIIYIIMDQQMMG